MVANDRGVLLAGGKMVGQIACHFRLIENFKAAGTAERFKRIYGLEGSLDLSQVILKSNFW